MANVCDNCGTVLRGPISGFTYTFGLAMPKGPDFPIPVQEWRAELCVECVRSIPEPNKWTESKSFSAPTGEDG